VNPALPARPSIESRLPRRAKQVLVAAMAFLILFLLLSLESSNTTPFLYIGF
jgi:hypothetical protein